MKTEFIKADISKPLDDQLTPAAEILKRGGLVAFPTETVYGLGACALDSDAAKKIYAAKGRPSDNPLIIHISRPEDAEKYCFTNETFYKLSSAFMPGPITVIMPKKPIIPDAVTGGLDTVAVRIPSDKVANKLIELCGFPIAAPSANISGKPSPTDADAVMQDMNGRIDMVIDGGECNIGVESTIVKPMSDGVKLLRPGGITVGMLEAVVGKVEIDPVITEKPTDDRKPEAPGMKYRHYAPIAKMTLICGDGKDFFERAAEFINKKISENENTGVLCTDEAAAKIKGKYVVSLGAVDDPAMHAHRLFKALRNFDDMPVDRIYAISDGKDEVELAVYNRMIKAAGYDIISI